MCARGAAYRVFESDGVGIAIGSRHCAIASMAASVCPAAIDQPVVWGQCFEKECLHPSVAVVAQDGVLARGT